MEKTKSTIELGATVKDKINGFSGIVTGDCKYLTGCRQFLVTPTTLKKDRSEINGLWLDEIRLERLPGENPIKKKIGVIDNPGGPQHHPDAQSSSTRRV